MYGFSTFFIGASSILAIVVGSPISEYPPRNGSFTFSTDTLPPGAKFYDTPTGIFRRTAQVCETTGGSPLAADIIDAATLVKDRQFCCQENTRGSECNLLKCSGTAAIGLCGKAVWCMSCSAVANFAESIASDCAWNDPAAGGARKAGGKETIDGPSGSIIVYHC